ncbi:hypothetical protein [Pontibacter sp. G13]|uniref:hypothetical protein n=1 Tax=Pontibacter sp. G13 TaxID=3074898 RepID=UPI00288AE431|nr:hypothetical protein [Pontibacter sp. G13]WNJ16426.1 hypothetical protein RJD25_16295 [Pontibacter sp. G13]
MKTIFSFLACAILIFSLGCEDQISQEIVAASSSAVESPVSAVSEPSLHLSFFQNHPEGNLTPVPEGFILSHPDIVSGGYGDVYLFTLHQLVFEVYALDPVNPLPSTHKLVNNCTQELGKAMNEDTCEEYDTCKDAGSTCYWKEHPANIFPVYTIVKCTK